MATFATRSVASCQHSRCRIHAHDLPPAVIFLSSCTELILLLSCCL